MRRLHVFTAILVAAFAPLSAHADTLHVSAAVSLTEALTQIAAAFQKQTGHELALTFGSSGQLAAQIKNGAEADVFISAADKQVDELIAAHDAQAATRTVVAANTLVLIVPPGAKDPPRSLTELSDARFARIAIGEPRTVPAGDYALQSLESAKVANTIKDRLVYGLNVRQVLAYVENGEVAAGIVYATDARESGDKVRVVATIDNSAHKPIEYPALVITSSQHKEIAMAFLAFFHTPEAEKILAEKGFSAAIEKTAASAPATRP
jgi:molybdate transport system substrate-binding protein